MAGVLSAAERVPAGDDDVVAPAAPGSAPDRCDPARFALPAVADIRVVADVLALCRRALEAEGDVTVDCGEVERVDAAVLQCLGALRSGLREADRRLILADPTAELDRAVEVLGFDALLGRRTSGTAPSPA